MRTQGEVSAPLQLPERGPCTGRAASAPCGFRPAAHGAGAASGRHRGAAHERHRACSGGHHLRLARAGCRRVQLCSLHGTASDCRCQRQRYLPGRLQGRPRWACMLQGTWSAQRTGRARTRQTCASVCQPPRLPSSSLQVLLHRAVGSSDGSFHDSYEPYNQQDGELSCAHNVPQPSAYPRSCRTRRCCWPG